MSYPAEIIERPETRLGAVRHGGPDPEMGVAVRKGGGCVGAAGSWSQTRGMAGVFYDSPMEVAPEALRSDAGVILTEDAPLPDGLVEVRLPGGRHAILHLTGPYEQLPDAWNWLYASWLPEQGVAPGGVPFEIYLNDPTTVPPSELKTDICVPLAP
mgnify:CR=1 FL=1